MTAVELAVGLTAGVAAAPVAVPTAGSVTSGSGRVAIVVGLDDGEHTPRAVVLVADVDRREAALRASPASSRLPRAGTSEGRQLRRWIAHCLAAQAIVATEELPRMLSGGPDPDAIGTSTDRTDHAGTDHPVIDDLLPGAVDDALGAGSIALAVLGSSAAARGFAGRLTGAVTVAPETVRRLAVGHPVRSTRRAIHRVDGRPVNGGRPVSLTVDEVPAGVAAELAAAAVGQVLTGVDSAGHEHRLTILDEPSPSDGSDGSDRSTTRTVAGSRSDADGPGRSGARTAAVATVTPAAAVAAAALRSARARAFGRWLDGRREVLVHARPGYEHPADPGQPDNTHRH